MGLKLLTHNQLKFFKQNYAKQTQSDVWIKKREKKNCNSLNIFITIHKIKCSLNNAFYSLLYDFFSNRFSSLVILPINPVVHKRLFPVCVSKMLHVIQSHKMKIYLNCLLSII